MYKLFFIIFAIFFLTACATPKPFYEEAKNIDTIDAYIKFRQDWPYSKEYVALANERLKKLYTERDKREEKRKKQEREKRLNLLKDTTLQLASYEMGSIDIFEFINKWPLSNTFVGKSGILEIYEENGQHILKLGVNSKYDSIIGNSAQKGFDFVLQGSKKAGGSTYTYSYFVAGNESYEFCEVIFTNNLISSVRCLDSPKLLKRNRYPYFYP